MTKFAAVLVGALMFASTTFAQGLIVSKLGGKCLDVEGGVRIGARLIGFECHGGPNQSFKFTQGRLTVGGYCAQADSRNQGSEIRLAQCNFSGGGNHLQNFAAWEGKYIGHNTGYVLDLKGGTGHWWGNQPVILWTKHGGNNQLWMKGRLANKTTLTNYSGTLLSPGKIGFSTFSGGRLITDNGAGIVGQNGANVIGQNGANIVANHGSRLIAAGRLQ